MHELYILNLYVLYVSFTEYRLILFDSFIPILCLPKHNTLHAQ